MDMDKHKQLLGDWLRQAKQGLSCTSGARFYDFCALFYQETLLSQNYFPIWQQVGEF